MCQMQETASRRNTAHGFEDALDSLHTLPLSIMPLQSPGLRKATMIKNARLESVIEVFRDTEAGSGQIGLEDIPDYFENRDVRLTHDMAMLETVGGLQSFDVFSLRSELRRIDVGFEDYGVLALSEAKRVELGSFMRDFTRPLVARIFGDDADDIEDVSRIADWLSNPDRDVVIRGLKTLAAELEIGLEEVPLFLKHYGDVFLSLSYFRQCLAELREEIPDLLLWMNEVRETGQVRGDPARERMLNTIDDALTEISASITTRFEQFDAFSKSFWEDVSAESFRLFGAVVTAQHVGIGAMLCGLTVKLMLWRERFPSRGGPPTRRIEFLSSEILPGLERIKAVQRDLDDAARLN